MKDSIIHGIKAAFSDLKENDGFLFDCPIEDADATEFDPRKLHEVCINHRLSNHLENNLHDLINNSNDPIFFDIEFNREGGSYKQLHVNGRLQVVRPDIIAHNRRSGEDKRNVLIVECKKEGARNNCINEDKVKILAFMNSKTYSYEFGLQVIYGTRDITGIFFYWNEGKIIEEQISS